MPPRREAPGVGHPAQLFAVLLADDPNDLAAAALRRWAQVRALVTDRRRLLVHASDRGRMLQGALQEPMQEAEVTTLAALSRDEIAVLRDLLKRIG